MDNNLASFEPYNASYILDMGSQVGNEEVKRGTLKLNTCVGVDVSHYYVHIADGEVLASQEEGVNSNEEGYWISSTQCKDAQVTTNFIDVVPPLE
jgi:hypothetical protein